MQKPHKITNKTRTEKLYTQTVDSENWKDIVYVSSVDWTREVKGRSEVSFINTDSNALSINSWDVGLSIVRAPFFHVPVVANLSLSSTQNIFPT